MGFYETRSIHSFLERNYLSIKDAFELLGMQDDYEGFLQDCEAEIRRTPLEALRVELDGYNVGYRSSTQTLRMALRHAYILTRLAEREIGEGGFEKPLFLLNEASFHAGLAQGIGWMKFWENWQPETDSSEAGRHAATTKHLKAAAPVMKEIIRLLEAQNRDQKWNFLSTAIDSIESDLRKFLIDTRSRLKLENMARTTVPNWSGRYPFFWQDLARFVEFEQPSDAEK